MAEVEEVAGAVVAAASAPVEVVVAVGVAVGAEAVGRPPWPPGVGGAGGGVAVLAEAVVALERSNMPTRHISMPQSLNRSRLQ